VDAFRRARALGPDDAATSHDLAVSLQKTGDLSGALEEYAAAAGLNPTEPATRVGQAAVLDAQGKASEAVSAYEEALRRLQDGPEADRTRARIAQLRGHPPAGGA